MVAFDPAGNVAVLYRKFAKMEETGRRPVRFPNTQEYRYF